MQPLPAPEAGAKSQSMNQDQQQQDFRHASDLLKQGDARAVEDFCRQALVRYPLDPNFMCLSARALLMLQRYAEAEERLNETITMFPEFSRSHVVLGELRLIQGRHEQAATEFRRATELGDTDPNTRIKLGRALALEGDREGANAAVNESLRLDPARERLAQAFEFEKTGKKKEAEAIYRDILKHDPENVDALRLLAGLATTQNEHRDAEVLLRRALELAPDFGRAMADLVVNLIEQEKIDDALQFAARLTRIGPDNPDTFLLLGNAYGACGRHDEAIGAYEKALSILPAHPGALSGLAHNLKTTGRQEEAVAAYRKCIEKNPYFAEAYWSLANLKTFRFTDQEVAAMQSLLEHPHIPDDAQVYLCNALGFHYEAAEDYQQAFSFFERCNVVRRKQEYYDPVETEFLYDRIIDVFDRDFVAREVAGADGEVTPIFIVGLPRSGSTLLEQILASHSLVEGTHELSDLPRVVRSLPGARKPRQLYPDALRDAEPAILVEAGRSYIERTRKFRSGRPYFIDKNPNNFVHVGLLHLALPNALIINAMRHPLDSCVGSFKQLFAKGQAWSYDLSDIGEYYLQYERLMAHWREILPGRVLDVRYEDVVADLEGQVQRILEYCGLPFEPQCLEFHETERPVKTASSEQVRQPIYRSAVGRWRHYEDRIEPLIEILAPLLRDLPESGRPHLLHKYLREG